MLVAVAPVEQSGQSLGFFHNPDLLAGHVWMFVLQGHPIDDAQSLDPLFESFRQPVIGIGEIE